MWTDEQIKELAKKHGWWAVESWWQQAVPRFRAMLEEYAAQQSVNADVMPCGHPLAEAYQGEDGGTYCRICESA